LKRVEEPSVRKVVKELNSRVFNSILINSTSLHLTFHNICSSAEVLMLLGRGLKYYGGSTILEGLVMAIGLILMALGYSSTSPLKSMG
jgi:hypothetical protein